MTFEDDFLQLDFGQGRVFRVTCKASRINWPPPTVLTLLGYRMRQVSISKITDQQRATVPNISRGAAYKVM